jgi:hypothetical protein
LIADCVANAPGGPVHVLVDDTEAEHIPGCNMAFRREALAAIGGFDVRYRAAGDDVDVCWRLQERGGRIGFHAGAMDWHHRRNSIAMYWRQQKGYGKAEALLEEKWPERYNAFGHLVWGGRLYGRGFALPISFGRARVYGGVWGSAAYQSLYEPGPVTLLALPLMPEWHLIIAALAALTLLGLSWPPLFVAAPLLLLAAAAPVAQAAIAATRAHFPVPAKSATEKLQRWMITFGLHLAQPVARLIGRITHGLTPWRRSGAGPSPWPRAIDARLWRETWRAPEAWVADLDAAIRKRDAMVACGGAFDEMDLEARAGPLGSARILVAIEEHGQGRQLARVRARGRASRPAALISFALLVAGILAGVAGATVACIVLSLAGAAGIRKIVLDIARSLDAVRAALPGMEAK